MFTLLTPDSYKDAEEDTRSSPWLLIGHKPYASIARTYGSTRTGRGRLLLRTIFEQWLIALTQWVEISQRTSVVVHEGNRLSAVDAAAVRRK